MTKFATCFLLVFGELAFGGMLALSLPPFFKIERGFYKSSAGVYLTAALVTAVGLGLLASRGDRPGAPPAAILWINTAIWALFCLTTALYLLTLWSDNGYLRARSYTACLFLGLIGVVASAAALKPVTFGAAAAGGYVLTSMASSAVLGLASVGMLLGHWYLIDPNLEVSYLQDIVKFLGAALIIDLIAVAVVFVSLLLFGSNEAAAAAQTLIHSDLALLAMRMVLGPVASLVLAWMVWETLKVPQTMAATGLLYIAVMSVLVGELLRSFILFRTSLPL